MTRMSADKAKAEAPAPSQFDLLVEELSAARERERSAVEQRKAACQADEQARQDARRAQDALLQHVESLVEARAMQAAEAAAA